VILFLNTVSDVHDIGDHSRRTRVRSNEHAAKVTDAVSGPVASGCL